MKELKTKMIFQNIIIGALNVYSLADQYPFVWDNECF